MIPAQPAVTAAGVTGAVGGETPKSLHRTYGGNEFINKVSEILGGKYAKDFAVAMQEPPSLQSARIQSIIMVEILEEIRISNMYLKTLASLNILDTLKSSNEKNPKTNG